MAPKTRQHGALREATGGGKQELGGVGGVGVSSSEGDLSLFHRPPEEKQATGKQSANAGVGSRQTVRPVGPRWVVKCDRGGVAEDGGFW